MAVTEIEQIEAEIAAIFSVRPASDCNILDRLEVGKEMMSEVFLFAQYRGFALYDGLVVNFKMAGTIKWMDLRHCRAGCG